jgi:hypothetical protein
MRHRWGPSSNPVSTIARSVRAGAARLRPLGERRKTGRIKGGKLRCNLGSVIDISAGGMRVRSSRRLQGHVKVELWTHLRRAKVRAEVVWCGRLRFRRYEVGLQFLDMSDEAKQDLTAMALYARHG